VGELREGAKRFWWILATAVLGLFGLAIGLSVWASDVSQGRIAEAAGISEDRVEMSGLDAELLGFTNQAELDEAIAAADAVDLRWNVHGVVAGAEDVAAPSADSDADGDDDAGAEGADAADGEDADGDRDGGGEDTDAADGEDTDGDAAAEGEDADGGDSDADADADADADGDSGDGDADADGGASDGDGDDADGDGSDAGEGGDAGGGTNSTGGAADDETDGADKELTNELNALFDLEPIEFGYFSAALSDESKATLDRAAEILNTNPETGQLKIVGHTDPLGPAGGNRRLSTRRAQAVKDYLVSVGGVEADRLMVEGRGESELLVPIGEGDWGANRRIEWELVD